MNFTKTSVLAAAAAAGLFVSSCGLNPFGAGESGFRIFAHLGKAVAKPSQINDEQGSKQNSQTAVGRAQGQALRLAKSDASGTVIVDPPWLKAKGITGPVNDVYTYYEDVLEKPSDEDAAKLVTGRGEVQFKYTAGITPTLGAIDTSKITAIISFEMFGKEYKTWNRVTDTIHVKIEFLNPDVKDLKPGRIWAWGKNISDYQSNGAGDTACFELDSLDDVNHIQYGEGHFLDAHTGRAHDGDPYSFDFDMQVIHKNTVDPSKPYLRYQDNEGIVFFYLPRPVQKDSLYFTIHFYPQYERKGTIQKDGPDGKVMVKFEYNEKLGSGTATYYNEDGDVIGTENL